MSEPAPIAFSVADAARRAGISRSMLYEIVAAGELPLVRVRNRSLILDSDLRQFLEHRRVSQPLGAGNQRSPQTTPQDRKEACHSSVAEVSPP